MLFTVKYKRTKYKTSFLDSIKINWINLLLLIKRIVRRARIIIPNNLAMYALLTICWLLYGTLILFCGKVYKAPNSYGICDAIWELKNSYFTSVVIAIFINAYNQITSYKEKIAAQHNFYSDALLCFDKLFYPFLGNTIFHYCPFYNNLCLDATLEHITNCKKIYIDEDEFVDILEDILIQLNKIDDLRKNNRIIGMHKDELKDNIDYARKILNKVTTTKIITIEDTKNISQHLFHIIADMRRPWRWDIDDDLKILRYLNKNPSNEIENNFYYNMLLNGFKFI